MEKNEKYVDGVTFVFVLCLIVFSFTAFIYYRLGRNDVLIEKCLETQGRYDFCVQEVSYKVK